MMSSTAPHSRADGTRRVVAANTLVFVSSAFIMTLELVAARLVAEHLGVSLYTWTAVIGVMLAGISIGNYVGGKLADLYAARALLTTLFLLASLSSLSVLFIVDWMGSWERPETISWPLWILRNVAFTFLAPATFLGMISPAAAKIGLEARAQVGTTVGGLYASGAAGSILGTFMTGYVLVDRFGSKAIVIAIAAGLALLGLIVALGLRRSPAPFFGVWLGIVVLIGALSVGTWDWAERWGYFFGLRFDTSYLHYADESSYFNIEIYDADELENTRVLALDHLVHSYVSMDDPTRLEYGYELVYAAITARLFAEPRRPEPAVFFIGGGGFTFPRYMESLYPDVSIDVAEIDPSVKLAAQIALGLPADDRTRIQTHTVDARNFIDDRRRALRDAATTQRYDFVYGDAFNDLGVPYHLTTSGFNERMRETMTPAGVYLINVIDVYREGYGRFLGAYVNTVRHTFDNVYVFSTEPDGTSEERDTYVVAASARPLDVHDLGTRPEDLDFSGTLFAWVESGVERGDMATLLRRGGGVVLTDDYAPVDNLLAPIFALQ